MNSQERQLLNFLFLASVSARKQQQLGRDRFLILAMVRAAQAGWFPVAVACRELVIAGAPQHLLNRFPETQAALQSEEFQTFLKQLERFCPAERAEQLAMDLAFDAEKAQSEQGGDVELVARGLLDGARM